MLFLDYAKEISDPKNKQVACPPYGPWIIYFFEAFNHCHTQNRKYAFIILNFSLMYRLFLPCRGSSTSRGSVVDFLHTKTTGKNVAIQVNKVGQVLEEQIKRCENRGKSGQKEFSMEGKELLIPYSDFCIKTRNIKTSQKV